MCRMNDKFVYYNVLFAFLGRIWGLDLDSLRINQVCEYYSSGFDLLGLEVNNYTQFLQSSCTYTNNSMSFIVYLVNRRCDWKRHIGVKNSSYRWDEITLLYRVKP